MYISESELEVSISRRILIQLTNDDPKGEQVKQSILTQAITFACERIDSYLRARYALPLEGELTLLKSYALNLARHFLYARRAEMVMPQTIKELYEESIKQLEAIARGKIHPGFKEREKGEDLPAQAPYFKARGKASVNTGGYL